MNRLIVLSGLLLIGLTAIAQDTTLGYTEYLQGTPILYTSPNGGYAFGNNGYGDKAKAQSYTYQDPLLLKEVLLLFGDVIFASGDSSSTVRVNVYDNVGQGVTSIGISDSIAPDGILASIDLAVHELLDDGNFTHADFAGIMLEVDERFSVGIDLTMLSVGDTVGLMSTTDGDAAGSFNAWELAANDTWFTIEDPTFSWGLDVDLAIFPVFENPNGVSEFPEEVPWSIYPNPSIESVRVSMNNSDSWQLTVRDVLGKQVYSDYFIGRSHTFDVNNLENGVYLISVTNSDRTSTQRLIVK